MSNIEIKGIGFPNKGADLLLNACLQSPLLKNHNHAIALEPYGEYRYKVLYPLWIKLRIDIGGFNILSPFLLLPDYFKKRVGWVNPADIDLILDASGYAYGDGWKYSLAKSRILNEVKSFPTVLLPQSFGPFELPHSRKVIIKLISDAKLVFAREQLSADYIYEITGVKVSVVPDITFNLRVDPSIIDSDVIVIPNFQVMERGDRDYIANLTTICKEALLLGRRITLLNHEGIKDQKICDEILEKLNSFENILILNPKTGIEAKSIIANANFVITSRYHGLVSALSSNVPVFTIGWSFKYEELLKKFNLLDFIKGHSNNGYVAGALNLINNADYCSIFASSDYNVKLEQTRKEVSEMWSSIINYLENTNS